MTRAAALFETLRVRDGTVPLLERHMRRLHEACSQVGLKEPSESLGMGVLSWARERPDDHVLRLEWDGREVEWTDRPMPAAHPVRIVTAAEPHPGYPVKSVRREAFDRALAAATASGADEPLLLTGIGEVAETARFAIAWLDGERLCVPDLTLGILPSIGRARLIEVAQARGMAVAAGRYGRAVLGRNPVVLVNAVRGPVPVALLDGGEVPIPEALAGLRSAFWPEP